jgi:methyl-accepting chemotaxis protein
MKLFFQKMSLKTQLLLAFFSVCIFIIFVGYSSYHFGEKTISQYRKIALKNLPSSIIATSLRGTAKDLRSTVFRMALYDTTKDELETLAAKISELTAQYTQLEIEYSALSLEDEEILIFNSTKEKWIRWIEVTNKMTEQRLANQPDSLKNLNLMIRSDFRESANSFNESINNLIMYHQQNARLNRESAEKSDRTGFYATIVFISAGFLLALSIGLFLGHVISKKLISVSKSLSGIMAKVGFSTSEINQISHSLAQSSNQQAVTLQQTSSAVTEITATIARTSESVARSKQQSEQSQTNTKEGQMTLKDLFVSVDILKKTCEDIINHFSVNNKNIETISKLIQTIHSKTSVINEIVFQTKLLSFNASVEAARAGEYGKGFSVVAQEIGQLAQLSGASAQEISTALDSGLSQVALISADSKSMMTSVAIDIYSQLDHVMKKIIFCESSFKKIFESSAVVTQDMNQVFTASNEQNVGMQEISVAMNQLNSTTGLNVASAKTAANTAGQLQIEVENLKQSIENLKITISGNKNNLTLTA